nr:MAG TPA: hypothetical protein [Caudoviricetes sp.]
MKQTIIALSLSLITLSAHATNSPGADCVGTHACRGAVTENHNPTATAGGGHASQQQQQDQSVANNVAATGNGFGGSASIHNMGAPNNANSYQYSANRYWSVRPVEVQATPIVTPAANVVATVGAECAPRMLVNGRRVFGINNRPLSTQTVDVGVDERLSPDLQMPYRKVFFAPGQYQLIGHRVSETSAVVTTSSGGGLGFAANGNGGAGGSIGGQTSGAMQRLVTTIRLHECVAATVQEVQPVVAAPAPAPVKKAYVARRKPVVRKLKCDCENKGNKQ